MGKKGGGDNRQALVAKTKDIFTNIMSLEDERAEINAAIAEQYAKLKRMGISVKAARASLARYKLEEQQREIWDQSFDLTAEALGVNIEFQMDFFEDAELFDPSKADEPDEEEPDNEDGDGNEVHLSEEELALAAQTLNQPGDEPEDPDEGDEQKEGEAALKALSQETEAAQALATKH